MKYIGKRYSSLIIVIFLLFLSVDLSFGFGLTSSKWDQADMPVHYAINSSGSSDTSVFSGVESSFTTWTNVSNSYLSYTRDGNTSNTSGGVNDGTNLMVWVESGWSYDPNTIGLCSVWSSGGRSLDSDIEFNGEYFTWSSSGEAGKMDVQNIATHEAGHASGLADLYSGADSEKTMYGMSGNGETKKRSLASDDILGIQFLYPTGGGDSTPPDTSISSGPSGTWTSSNNLTYTFTGSDDTTSTANLVYQYQLVGYDASYSSASATTTAYYTSVPNGSYTFKVRAKDQAGNVDLTPATSSLTLNYTSPDTTAPDTSIDSGPSGTITVDSAAFTFSGTDDTSASGNLTFSYYLDGYDFAYSSYGSSTTKSYSGLTDGGYTFYVKSKDEAGNIDPSPASRSFTVALPAPDSTAPDTSITSAPSGTISTTSATFTFSGSDDMTDGTNLVYSYYLQGVDSDFLAYTASTSVTYTGLANSDFTFHVRAKDEAGNVDASPASQSFTVLYSDSGNARPIAAAGDDKSVDAGFIQLDGSNSSDPDGDAITYSWSHVPITIMQPVSITGADTATPSFTLTTAMTYQFKLVVNDGTVDSVADYINVTVNDVVPVANAGDDQTVMFNTEVTLDGSGSYDPNGSAITYLWTAPAGVTLGNSYDISLSDTTAAKPTFTPTVAGVYEFSLTVNDGTNNSDPDKVNIIVNSDNAIPVADSGSDQYVSSGDTVTLDGSNSSDADGDTLTYSWRQISGTTVTLSDSTAVSPTFTTSGNDTLSFGLIVNDGEFGSPEDIVDIYASDEIYGSTTITKEGGIFTFNTDQGIASLLFVYGTLTDDLVVSVGKYASPPNMPEGFDALGVAMEFEPDGATFSSAVRVGISYTDEQLGSNTLGQINVFYLDPDTGTYTNLPVVHIDTPTNTVYFQTTHFSVYRLATEKADDTTTTGGGDGDTTEEDKKEESVSCFIAEASFRDAGKSSLLEDIIGKIKGLIE